MPSSCFGWRASLTSSRTVSYPSTRYFWLPLRFSFLGTSFDSSFSVTSFDSSSFRCFSWEFFFFVVPLPSSSGGTAMTRRSDRILTVRRKHVRCWLGRWVMIAASPPFPNTSTRSIFSSTPRKLSIVRFNSVEPVSRDPTDNSPRKSGLNSLWPICCCQCVRRSVLTGVTVKLDNERSNMIDCSRIGYTPFLTILASLAPPFPKFFLQRSWTMIEA